jgi:preprotein translocase subunit SecF
VSASSKSTNQAASTVSPTDLAQTGLWYRLYNGLTRYEFVRRWPRWFAMSAVVILIGLITLASRGLSFGIDFKGGTVWQVPAKSASVGDVREAVRSLGVGSAKIQTLTSSGTRYVRIQAEETTPDQQKKVSAALSKVSGSKTEDVSVSKVGASWGEDVSRKAWQALGWFFVVIIGYISLRFEFKMAIAAIVAVIHDILITVGIYAVSGLQVSPATVVAFLTILGYSLYDTVVVFDKVDENVKLAATANRTTYTDIVNLSMNQMLMRSINTSLVAILPIVSLLVVGAGILGATALADFGFALFIGLLTGAYSSIFIASPLLAILKEREPHWKAIADKVTSRGGSAGIATIVGLDGAERVTAEIDATAALTGGSVPRPRKQRR